VGSGIPCISVSIQDRTWLIPPHHLLIEEDGLQLAVHVVLIAVLCGVGKRSDLDLTFGDPAHVVVLDGDPVHQGPEDLILDLLDASVLVKVLCVGHHRSGNDLDTTSITVFVLVLSEM